MGVQPSSARPAIITSSDVANTAATVKMTKIASPASRTGLRPNSPWQVMQALSAFAVNSA